MTVQDMVNYVAASAQVIDSYQNAIRKLASENESLKKAASAPQPVAEAPKAEEPAPKTVLDEDMLMKTANDMHTIYGKPSTATPEQIAAYWRENPNAMLSSLNKLASAQLERVVNGEHIGATRQEPQRKKASAEKPLTADEALWAKYK